jgi:predicted Zn-dependent protease
VRDLFGKKVMRQKNFASVVLSLSLAALLGGGVSVARASDATEEYNAYIEAGLIYENEDWQRYVAEVGERILAVSPHANRTYTFVLLDDPIINAFTPGEGYIYLTRGIISYMRSEDELAGVIGHEIGHNVAQHIGQRKTRHRSAQILGWLGVIATMSPAMLDLANTLSATASASYGRKDELEADSLSADWLLKSGYNPMGMVEGFQMLEDHQQFEQRVRGQKPVYHGIMRSHPEHQKRINDLALREDQYQTGDLIEPERDFYGMLNGLVFGDQAATGVAKGNKFYHGALRIVIEFPKDWDTVMAGAAVLGRAPAPETATITVQRHLPAGSGQTPETYVKETLKRTDVINGESFKLGEFDAYAGEIKQADPNSPKKQTIGVVFRLGEVFLFRGELPTGGDLKAFEAIFRTTMGGLRGMTIEDLRIANSQRLKIIEAKPGDTFEKLAKGTALGPGGPDLLRVINGLYPNGEPRAGDLLKVVQ